MDTEMKRTLVLCVGLLLVGAAWTAAKATVPEAQRYDFNGDGIDGSMSDLVWYAGSPDCDLDSKTGRCDQETVNAMAFAMGLVDP